MTFTLPNGKEVKVKQFLYKHIRELLLHNNSLHTKLNYLEDFIVTKNLNVIEKFITLLMLREKCIRPTAQITIGGNDKDVNIKYILESFQECLDIRREVIRDNIEITLDYPSRFCVNTNNVLSVIRGITIEGEALNLDILTDEEFVQIINKLPADVLNNVNEFVSEKQDAFRYPLLQGKNNPINLNFLSSSPFLFIDSMFSGLDENTYREYLFILSRRIPDVNFLVNSTLVDILDYLELYKRECDEENEKLQK